MNIIERMELIREDCREDASHLDGQPMSGLMLGKQLGAILAVCDALAASIQEFARAVDTEAK